MDDLYHHLLTTLHWAVVIIAIGVVLWLNATNFDETELRAIGEIAAILAGTMGGQSILVHRRLRKQRRIQDAQRSAGYEDDSTERL